MRHGLFHHPLYKVWQGIKDRCLNSSLTAYPNYGGRGINICYTWRNDPASFIRWAKANGWKPGLEIDRINNDGNYEPDNCRFVTRQVNIQNSRATKLTESQVLEIMDKIKQGILDSKIAPEYNVSAHAIYKIRLGKSWTNITGMEVAG